MKATDLTGDLTFEGLLKNWEENGRPPEVLIDKLLDHGLQYQAENVRWCVQQEYSVDSYRNRIPGGIRPHHYGGVWCWNRGGEMEPKYRSEICSHRFSRLFVSPGKVWVGYKTYREALLALIDCEPS